MKIKVLLALDSYPGPTAGTEKQIQILLEGMDADAVEFGVALLRESEYFLDQPPGCPLHVAHLEKVASIAGIRAAKGLAEWAREGGYSLVHTFFNDTSIVLPRALHRAGLKVVLSRRDEGFWYTPASKFILRFNRRFVDKVIANSEAVARAVILAEGYDREAIRVIPNGVRKYEQFDMAQSTAANALGVPRTADSVVFGIAANLRPLKRVADAIRALARTRVSHPKVALFIAGGDRPGADGQSHLSELKALAVAECVDDIVSFLGHITEMNLFLRSIDIGLSCSSTEGMSNTVLEMMAAGRPVIATNVGGNSQIVRNDVNGFLYEAGDVEALARHMISLCADANCAKRLGGNAINTIEQDYSVEKMTQSYLELYQEVCSDVL